MKTHAIIPIFISHLGCNNDCVFCNQKIITAREKPISPDEVASIIEEHLKTLLNRDIATIEIAFYGGSFTGLDIASQIAYLDVAKTYKEDGLIQKIHISTRPDYISYEILSILKEYKVDIIELGVQSFDDEVLNSSKRGHTAKDVYTAVDLIKEFKFEFGIQLMVGLPSDSLEKSIYSAMQTAKLKPKLARIYPTMVLPDTQLKNMLEQGEYFILSEKEMIKRCKEMYKILYDANINIMRVGLKSTDLINDDNITESNYHPAFRQIVEGEIAKDYVLDFLKDKSVEHNTLVLKANSKSFSNLIGHKAINKTFFKENINCKNILYEIDNSMKTGKYYVDIK